MQIILYFGKHSFFLNVLSAHIFQMSEKNTHISYTLNLYTSSGTNLNMILSEKSLHIPL